MRLVSFVALFSSSSFFIPVAEGEWFCFAGIRYTLSKSGRPAIFTRDPDANALEFVQVDA